ncbi:MAG: hypothetical protein H0V53_05350 [Rubrobacter sp.]|nr:hypothetical protein [Rubrobacter sp.]
MGLIGKNTQVSYAVCVNNEGYPIDLEPLKVYAVLPGEANERDLNLVRVIDETGEDYLYPSSYFIPVELPQTSEQTLMELMRSRSEA